MAMSRTQPNACDATPGVALQERYAKIRQSLLNFRKLHNIISDFYETSHTLNRNILFIRDKTIRLLNDSL